MNRVAARGCGRPISACTCSNERGASVAEFALHGMTISQGMVWLEQEISAFRRRPLPKPLRTSPSCDLPDHAVGRGAVFCVKDAAAFAELGRWYANADSVLRGLRRTDTQRLAGSLLATSLRHRDVGRIGRPSRQ